MAAPKGNKNAVKAKEYERALRAELHFYQDEKLGIKKGQALARIAKRHVEDAMSDDPQVRIQSRESLMNRLDGKPREHVELDYTQRLAEEMTDDELLNVIRNSRGGGDSAADAPELPEDAPGVH